MTGIWDDALRYMGGCSSHYSGHHGSKGLFSTDGENWHAQFTFCNKRFVVDGILIKRFELFEAGMHCTGACIDGCVVLAGCLVEQLRVGSKLVPESVQVDSFTTFDEAFG